MTDSTMHQWYNCTTREFDAGPTDAKSAVDYLNIGPGKGGGAARNLFRLLTEKLEMDWIDALRYVYGKEIGDVPDDLQADVDARLGKVDNNG